MPHVADRIVVVDFVSVNGVQNWLRRKWRRNDQTGTCWRWCKSGDWSLGTQRLVVWNLQQVIVGQVQVDVVRRVESVHCVCVFVFCVCVSSRPLSRRLVLSIRLFL